jgi:hypothetical protein
MALQSYREEPGNEREFVPARIVLGNGSYDLVSFGI